MTCLLAGVVATVLYIFPEMKDRATKMKKGYEVGNMGAAAAKMILISAVILVFSTDYHSTKVFLVFLSGLSLLLWYMLT